MNETTLKVNRIVKEGIAISYIEVKRSKWNGVHFDNFMTDTYTMERVRAFRVHAHNYGKDLKLIFNLTFDEYDRWEDYMEEICNIETKVTIHFDDMEHEKYSIKVKSKFGEPLKKFIEGCIGVKKDAFENMVRNAWEEQEANYFVELEFKEKIGEQDFLYDLVDKVKETVIAECIKCAGL